MKTKLLAIAVLSFAIILTALTRFYKLGEVPSGLYIDEAGQGYSAYSILKTGKDEFAKAYPIVFRSFTDFKTPVYIYTVVPLISFFGLTPFTVRLPSFIFSILTIPVLYLLIRQISPEKVRLPLSLLAIILLAISPWHILFGRTNFECNLALFFFLSGVYIFYLSLRRPYLLVLASILFAIAIPAYHSQRLITPVIATLLVLRHRKIIFDKQRKAWVVVALLFGLIISLPTLFVATTPGFLARASGLNIFTNTTPPAGLITDITGIYGFLINSRWFLSAQEFTALYFSYFIPRAMFSLGDYGPRSSFPELATFFAWQLPFYLIGLYVFFKTKLGELKFFTLALLLVSPIPAGVTRDPYTTIRSLPLVIPQIILISLGIIWTVKYLQNFFAQRRIKNLFWPSVSLFSLMILVYSLAKLYSSVILLNEYFRAKDWDWGWRTVVETIDTFDKKLPVVVDNSREEAYIELAFFLKYDPALYQKENKEIEESEYYTNMSRNTTVEFGNIITRPVVWEKDLRIEQYLIGDELAISQEQIDRHGMTLIKEIKYPDKLTAFRIVKTNP